MTRHARRPWWTHRCCSRTLWNAEKWVGIRTQDSLGTGIAPFVLNRRKKVARGNAHEVRSSDNFHQRQGVLSDKELSLSDYADSRSLHSWKTLIQNAAVRPKTQPRPRENPDMLPEMLGAIRTQGTRIRTARLGSDSVVCNGDLARLRVVLNIFSQTHDAYTGSEGVPSTVEMVP